MQTWRYVQATGELIDPDGKVAEIGYAGRAAGLNNPAMEAVHEIGPLPQGRYSVYPRINHTRLGSDALPLSPYGSNVMWGRGGFYVHADNAKRDHSASEGCIVMGAATRARLVPGTVIEVVAERGPKSEVADDGMGRVAG